jgi:hypothetical protein
MEVVSVEDPGVQVRHYVPSERWDTRVKCDNYTLRVHLQTLCGVQNHRWEEGAGGKPVCIICRDAAKRHHLSVRK